MGSARVERERAMRREFDGLSSRLDPIISRLKKQAGDPSGTLPEQPAARRDKAAGGLLTHVRLAATVAWTSAMSRVPGSADHLRMFSSGIESAASVLGQNHGVVAILRKMEALIVEQLHPKKKWWQFWM